MSEPQRNVSIVITLWRTFYAICCFKRKPQDLPVSGELLNLSLVFYVMSSFLLALSTEEIKVAVFTGVIDGLLLALLTYLLLLLMRKPERWTQTTTALAGTGIIFSFLVLPFSFLIVVMNNNDPLIIVPFIFVISLIVWNIGVMAHIIRHALTSSFPFGVLVALVYIWIITTSIRFVFPTEVLA